VSNPRNPLMVVTISVDWTAREWRLDCTWCDWSHTINASYPTLGAVAQFALDHVLDTHTDPASWSNPSGGEQ
jgi:hypothetical protein